MIGNGAIAACFALYFRQIVGLSVTEIGIGLTVGGLAGLLSGVPCGYLADRLGARLITVVATVLTAVASLAYLTVTTFAAFVVAAIAFAFVDRGAYAALQALLAGTIADKQELVRARAFLRAITNVGLAAGAGLGAVALASGTRMAYVAIFVINSASFVLSAAMLMVLPSVAGREVRAGEPRLLVFRDRRYVTLTALNVVVFMHFSLLEFAVPLWVVGHTEAPRALVGVMLAINTLAVAFLQVRIARRVPDLTAAARAFRVSALALSAACLLFALSAERSPAESVVILLLAASVHVFGEMGHSAAAWTASFHLAPGDHQGQYQGFFSTGFFAAQTLGPIVFSFLLIGWGVPGWIVLATLFTAAGFAIAIVVGRVDSLPT